jgi:hypothetical protein
LPDTARGNAGVFSGFGQDIQLIDSKDVQMVSEDILIRPGSAKITSEGKTYDVEKADYVCAFTLKNLSGHPVAVQVGFPLDSQFFNRPDYNTDYLQQITNDYHFVVLEGQQSYPVRFSREDKDKEFKSIFLWDMAFKAGESKELRISYTMPFSMGAGGSGKEYCMYAKPWYRYFENCFAEGFGYVTETGKSWTGKIGHARFRVDLRAIETLLNQRGPPEGGHPSAEMEARLEKEEKEFDARFTPSLDEKAKERWAEQRKQMKEERVASFPIAKPPVFREVSLAGWKEATDGSIVWDLKDYTPGNPITVTYNFVFCIPQTRDDTKQLIEKTFKNNLTDDDAQDLEDIIRAFYGVKVNNPRVAAFLENQKWYPAGGQRKLPPGIIQTIEEARRGK